MSKVWFITGAGRGLGREFARAALSRGDRVAATARDVSTLADLVETFDDAVLPLVLDVTDEAGVARAVEQTAEKFGRIDVIVNNAGYGLFGAVEELSADELRRQIDVNVLGPFFVVKAALPLLREQGSGHILQISSVAGLTGIPQLGGYNASKFALEGLSEALAGEVAAFGVKVTIVEPAGYATDWGGSSAVHAAPHPAYDPARAMMAEAMKDVDPSFFGDPAAAAAAVLELVDADEPPSRVLLGAGAFDHQIRPAYQGRLDEWDKWSELSARAQR